MHPNLLALGAILLWSSLATLGVSLAALPPFLLTGLALLIGSLPAWPLWRQWRVPPLTLALGVGGLFGYHFLLFLGLRLAPPVEANLVNYLWPLLIVLLAPVLLPGTRLRLAHVLAGLLGFSGAALAILGGSDPGAADADTGVLGRLSGRRGRGVHLGCVLAVDPPGPSLSDRCGWPVRAAVGPAVAALPSAARTIDRPEHRRHWPGRFDRPGPDGRCLLPLGPGPENRGRPDDRIAQLPDAARFNQLASSQHRPRVQYDAGAGDGDDRRFGPARPADRQGRRQPPNYGKIGAHALQTASAVQASRSPRIRIRIRICSQNTHGEPR